MSRFDACEKESTKFERGGMMADEWQIIMVCPACGSECIATFRAAPIRFEGDMRCPECGETFPVVFICQSDGDGGESS